MGAAGMSAQSTGQKIDRERLVNMTWRPVAARAAMAAVLSLTLLAACGDGDGRADEPSPPAPVPGLTGLQCTGAQGSGWCWQLPLPDGNRLLDSVFVDRDHGWAVAESGRVWHTTDGGQRWDRLPDVTGATLVRIAFADPLNGWALTDQRGVMANSRDGGRSWRLMRTPDAEAAAFQDYFGLMLVDANTPVVVGWHATSQWATEQARVLQAGGSAGVVPVLVPDRVLSDGTLWRTRSACLSLLCPTVARSPDLGRTLAPLPAGLYAIHLADARTAWALGGEELDGLARTRFIGRSLDGGASFDTWPAVFPDGSGISWLEALVLSPQGHGWGLNGGQAVLRTEDGARSWHAIAVPAWADGRPAQKPPQPLGPDGLWLLQDDQLHWTRDAGRHWQRLAMPEAGRAPLGLARDGGGGLQLDYLERLNPSRPSALDDGLRRYRSIDEGGRWLPMPGAVADEALQGSVGALWFFDDRSGLALTDDGRWLDTGDGGYRWRSRAAMAGPCCESSPNRLLFTPGGQGWAIVRGLLQRSDDRGLNWRAVPLPVGAGAARSIQLVDDRQGWLVDAGGLMFLTTDAGLSWSLQPPVPPGWSTVSEQGRVHWLAMADRRVGLAAPRDGSSWVLRTTDGGQTWRPTDLPLGADARVQWVSGNEVWAAWGRSAWHSLDGGEHWQAVPLPLAAPDLVLAMHFVDARRGWFVGTGGRVLSTTDGGATWQLQPSGSQARLESVFALNGGRAWIGGARSTILATVTSGQASAPAAPAAAR